MNRTVLRNLVGAIGGARAMALSRSATSSEGRSTFGRAALAAAVGSSVRPAASLFMSCTWRR